MLLLFSAILLLGCSAKISKVGNHNEINEEMIADEIYPDENIASEPSFVSQEPKLNLGRLCSGRVECNEFCMNNKGRCSEYCSKNPENELCQTSFSYGSENVCSDGSIMFDYPPVNLDKITHIEPMGSLHGEHVAPIDHQYYQNFNNNEINIEVYSPAKGVITEIQHMGSFKGDIDRTPFDDYRLIT